MLSCRSLSLYNYLLNESAPIPKTKSYLRGLIASLATVIRESRGRGIEPNSIGNGEPGHTSADLGRQNKCSMSAVHFAKRRNLDALNAAESDGTFSEMYWPDKIPTERISRHQQCLKNSDKDGYTYKQHTTQYVYFPEHQNESESKASLTLSES